MYGSCVCNFWYCNVQHSNVVNKCLKCLLRQQMSVMVNPLTEQLWLDIADVARMEKNLSGNNSSKPSPSGQESAASMASSVSLGN